MDFITLDSSCLFSDVIKKLYIMINLNMFRTYSTELNNLTTHPSICSCFVHIVYATNHKAEFIWLAHSCDLMWPYIFVYWIEREAQNLGYVCICRSIWWWSLKPWCDLLMKSVFVFIILVALVLFVRCEWSRRIWQIFRWLSRLFSTKFL